MTNAELARLVASDWILEYVSDMHKHLYQPRRDVCPPPRADANMVIRAPYSNEFPAWQYTCAVSLPYSGPRALVLPYPLAFSPDNVKEMG